MLATHKKTLVNQNGIAHLLLLGTLTLLLISVLGLYFYTRTNKSSKNFVLGTQTEANRNFVKNDTRACNAFNIRTLANYEGLTFHQSLGSAVSTILNNSSEPSSVLINRYGPWCDNEAHPSGAHPFARNLVGVIDNYAMFGACTFKTHGYPYVAHPDRIISEFIKDNPKYIGNIFNDSTSNSDLYNTRRMHLEHLVWTAYERNVNPYLLIGLWATESGWSNRPSCYTPVVEGNSPAPSVPFNVWAKGIPDAAGVYPIMVLKVKNVEVARWSVTGTLTQYSTKIATRDPKEISVHFINDGGARDLNVDYIQIDGDVYHSNAKNIYAKGVWRSGTCASGYFEQEWLHCNGYFQFNEH